MVTLPQQFVATWFPGYFFNTENEKLYTLKVTGELRELKMVYPHQFNKIHEPGYRVSVKGNRKFMAISKLKKLEHTPSEIPMEIKRGYF